MKDHVRVNATPGTCNFFANYKLRRYNSSVKPATEVHCTNMDSFTEPIIGSLKSTPRKRKRTPKPIIETWCNFGRTRTSTSYNSKKRKQLAEHTAEFQHNTTSPEAILSVKSTRRHCKRNPKACGKPFRAPTVPTLCCFLPDLTVQPCCHLPDQDQGSCCPSPNPALEPYCFSLDPSPGSRCFSLGRTPEPNYLSLVHGPEPTSLTLNRPKSGRCLSPNPTLLPCYFSPEPTEDQSCTSFSSCYNSMNSASEFYCLFITSVSETYYACLNRALELCSVLFPEILFLKTHRLLVFCWDHQG